MNRRRMITLFLVLLMLIASAMLGGCSDKAIKIPDAPEGFKPGDVPPIEEPLVLKEQPYLAYMKMVEWTDDGLKYSLQVSLLDGEPQSVAMRCLSLNAGEKGDVLFYESGFDRSNQSLYFLDQNGKSHFVDEKVGFYKLSKNGLVVLYLSMEQRGTIIIKEFTVEGDLVREDIFEEKAYKYDLNSTMDIVVYSVDTKPDENENANVRLKEIYIMQEGQAKKVVEKGVLSWSDNIVSENGTFLYLSDEIVNDGETIIGTLYRKEPESESVKVVESSTWDFSISDDGDLATAIMKDENGKESLFYQYSGEKPVVVENVTEYEIGEETNTLYYIVEEAEDWNRDLYRVSQGAEPELIADNATVIVDISADEESVAYLADFKSEKGVADLYLSRKGEQAELIDTGIGAYEFRGMVLGGSTQIYQDGSAIAYLKDSSDESRNYANLFVKEKGKPSVMIDKYVIGEFVFFR